ncbi:unnamed protein product [Caenorhabditis nigoni]
MWIEMINCVFCRQKRQSNRISRTSTSSATTSSIFTPAFPLNHNFNNTKNQKTQNQKTSTSSGLPSGSYDPPASAPARIPVIHSLVKSKSKFRQCDVCERYFIFDFVRRQHSDDVFACSVCGIRVHEACMQQLGDDCFVTSEVIRQVVEKAIEQNNKQKWEAVEATPPQATPPSNRVIVTSPTESSIENLVDASLQQPECSEDWQKNVHKSGSFNNNLPRMATTMTASSTMEDVRTLEDVTYHSEYENTSDDYEKELMQWRDITIQLSDVHVKGRIGDGRFGTVHIAEYHGDAAVKFVNMNYLREEHERMHVFTQEIVTAYKNSRHEHIALFYGYVVDPPTNTYAIVTNFYQHKTLYHRIHEATEDYEQSWTFQISLQICQAMSYLHRRKILHRDLRSKNILLDNPNRVVVADFALMKLERLAYPKRDYTLCIPNHWLDYLAPEVASHLLLDSRGEFMLQEELPFTGETDVYSFGTIFYELLLRRMPTGCDSWEQKLYAKMSGQKAALQIRFDPKLHELLMSCWATTAEKRPTFAYIVKRITSMMPRNKESAKAKRRSTAHENPLF